MIRFAKTLLGDRVYIDNAKETEVFYCEECNAKLIPRKGDVYKHHFAHKIDSGLTSEQRACSERNSGNSGKGEWHEKMQAKFSLESQERVIKNKDGITCRADVYLEEQNVVLEFQHSKISNEVFQKRNQFYNELGIKVIWLFDFDNILGSNIKWVPPTYYDEYIEGQIRKASERWHEKQDAYKIDKEAYIYMFGQWKPQENRKIEIHFIQRNKNYEFYKEIRMVSGNFDSCFQYMTVFAVDSKFWKEILNVKNNNKNGK